MRDSLLYLEGQAHVWLGAPVATALLSGPPRAGNDFEAISQMIKNGTEAVV